MFKSELIKAKIKITVKLHCPFVIRDFDYKRRIINADMDGRFLRSYSYLLQRVCKISSARGLKGWCNNRRQKMFKFAFRERHYSNYMHELKELMGLLHSFKFDCRMEAKNEDIKRTIQLS